MRYILAMIMLLTANYAMAVDGYKDMKFGMSKQEIIKIKPCALYKGNSAPKGAENLECDDLQFGGDDTNAGFFFIDGKLERVALILDFDKALGLATSLKDKYGLPSSSSTQKQIAALDTTPGSSAFLAFDSDTVILNLLSDDQMNRAAILIYTSKNYDRKIAEKQAKAINSDI